MTSSTSERRGVSLRVEAARALHRAPNRHKGPAYVPEGPADVLDDEHSARAREPRLDIHGHVLQLVENALDLGTNHHHFLKQRLRARIVPGGLERHQIVR